MFYLLAASFFQQNVSKNLTIFATHVYATDTERISVTATA